MGINWLETILKFIEHFYFFRVIEADEMGVHMIFGRWVRVLSPGIRFRFPCVDRMRTTNIKEQIINLPNQSVGEKAFSLTIRYDIEDVQKALLNVQDYDSSLQNLAMEIASNYMSKNTECSCLQLQSNIYDELTTEAEEWGINIINVGITDFAKHRVLRLMCHDKPLSALAE